MMLRIHTRIGQCGAKEILTMSYAWCLDYGTNLAILEDKKPEMKQEK